ncbi:MAG TPA: M48 family metalloprotease [Burkholderiales bacterium]|nr:M48 family metalloprotease [Burkholderiales bacterium]
MVLRCLLSFLLLLAPGAHAEGLPDLGDVSQASFTPAQERRLGENIMREIRADPQFYDDAEASDYLNALGDRLVAHSSDTRQSFSFFLIRDNQINAFALPGGYVGVNTGLFFAAQSESELAGVLGHEIAHVTQRHVARMIAQQDKTSIVSLAALAVAILAARASTEAASAAAAFGQAGVIQSQLNFTRDNEKEADRVGLQILEGAGFDPRGMASFFERLQRSTRIYEGGAPSYLRTHPLTHERIADVENRLETMPYRQVPDSLDFQLIRAKLKAHLETPRAAQAFFEEGLAERKFLSEAASRYGLTVSLLRQKNIAGAEKQYEALRKSGRSSPIIDALGCEIQTATGDIEGASSCYRTALKSYPNYRTFSYNYADLLLQARKPQAALQLVEERLRSFTEDHHLYLLQSRAYAMIGKGLAQHRALGEAYARMGNLPGAIEQLQIALKSGDGDFYQMSATEARLRQLRSIEAEAKREQRKK